MSHKLLNDSLRIQFNNQCHKTTNLRMVFKNKKAKTALVTSD